MDDRTVKQAVDRFLGWKLPSDFAPDCGISFDGRGKDARGYEKTWPVGTNLFTAEQARAMFEHCLASAPPAPQPEQAIKCPVDADGHCYNPKVCTATNKCAIHSTMQPEQARGVVEEIDAYCKTQHLSSFSAKRLDLLQRARDEIVRLSETWFDGETTWTVPTAWAYAMACKKMNRDAERIAALEQQLARVQPVIEAARNWSKADDKGDVPLHVFVAFKNAIRALDKERG